MQIHANLFVATYTEMELELVYARSILYDNKILDVVVKMKYITPFVLKNQ